MGQQVPFETLDQLARGILQDLRKGESSADAYVHVFVPSRSKDRSCNGSKSICVEQTRREWERQELRTAPLRDVWAPDTEGVAKLKDVMSFLWDGGTRGILNCLKPFQRAMFDKIARFKIPKRSAFFLCVTLLALIALTVINGVIVASAAAKDEAVMELSPELSITNSSQVLLASNWQRSLRCLDMVAVAFTLGIVLFLADLCRPERLKERWQRFISGLGGLR